MVNARSAASQVRYHNKLITLAEKINCDREIILLFLWRCMAVGRSFYLRGFRHEATELFSIASSRGYTEHSGPHLESMLAKYVGTKMTLYARSLMGHIKRTYVQWGQKEDNEKLLHAPRRIRFWNGFSIK